MFSYFKLKDFVNCSNGINRNTVHYQGGESVTVMKCFFFFFLFQVDGLAALILCSGVVVAAGNEPFKFGNYGFHRISQITQAMLIDTRSGLQPETREWSHDCNSFCKISTENIQIRLCSKFVQP